MTDLYKDFSKVYDECEVSDYSISFGNAMLDYLNRMHNNETFKKNLDICCGTGTLCNFFKDNGIETKGVDISKEMLDIARDKYPDIEFIECDVMKYQDDGTYDFVTSTDDAMSHLVDASDVRKVFRNVNNLLRVNGLFIFDINYFQLISFEKRDKSLDDYRRLTYHLKRDGKIITYNVEYYEENELLWKGKVLERDYSIEEITQILNEEGFALELCSQHFLNEKRCKKWKIVAKKIE